MSPFRLQAGRVKAHELRTKGKDELVSLLEERKTELASLRVSKVTQGAAPKLSQMYVTCLSCMGFLCLLHATGRLFLGSGGRVSNPRAAKTRSLMTCWASAVATAHHTERGRASLILGCGELCERGLQLGRETGREALQGRAAFRVACRCLLLNFSRQMAARAVMCKCA